MTPLTVVVILSTCTVRGLRIMPAIFRRKRGRVKGNGKRFWLQIATEFTEKSFSDNKLCQKPAWNSGLGRGLRARSRLRVGPHALAIGMLEGLPYIAILLLLLLLVLFLILLFIFLLCASRLSTRQSKVDGTLVQSNRPKQGIDVFDRSAGRCLVQMELHAGEDISSVAFDDRRRLFVTTLRGPTGFSLRFHDLVNPSATPRTRSLGTTTIAAFLSPDARIVGVQNKSGIELSDAETGQVLVHLADSPAQVLWPVGFSMDGRFVAGLCGNEILVWETERGRRIGHAAVAGRCDVFALSPRGRCLGWGEENGRLATLEPASGRVREFHAGSSEQKLSGHGLSFSSDERLLAVSTDGVPGGPSPPEVWELECVRRISQFPGRNDGGSASFVPGGHHVLVTTPSGPRIWRARAPRRARRAGRPCLGGLGRHLLARREGSGDRQRRHWQEADHQVLGPR